MWRLYATGQGIHTWLNLYHCKEKEAIFHAVNSGWDMVMADGSSLSVQQNTDFSNEVISYALSHGVLVEAEVGQVKGIEDDVRVRQDTIALREEIAKFLNKTDVDFITVAIGNAHGGYKVEPNLQYDLAEYTTSITDKSFVVHRGDGLPQNGIQKRNRKSK